jgi:hypothetical protein
MSQTKLSEADRAALLVAIEGHTLGPVAKALGVGREAVACLAAGLAVRPGTVALAEKNLPALRSL